MKHFKMSWLLTLIFLTFIFDNPSDASHHDKEPPSAVIVGTVYCETCFLQDFSKVSRFISGATVAVACKDTGSGPSFREEVKTNEHGEFSVHLPTYISNHLKKIKGCSVKLIRSSEPYCAVASTATSSSLHLRSRKQGTRIYSAGFFTFKPLKQPEVCNQKPNVPNPKSLNSVKSFINNPDDPTFAPPIEDPPMPIPPPIDPRFPQIPKLPPFPQLPPLPSLPGLPFSIPTPGSTSTTRPSEQNVPSLPKLPPHPFIPSEKKNPTPKGSSQKRGPSDEKIEEKQLFTPATPLLPLPTNQFWPPPIFPPILPSPPPSTLPPIFPSPPPSILPPIFPSPPPSLFPPIFPSPPSPPFFSFPPIPGLFPSPPPPPPPSLPFPLPPFPHLPPGFPGVPPAATTTTTIPPSKHTSP